MVSVRAGQFEFGRCAERPRARAARGAPQRARGAGAAPDAPPPWDTARRTEGFGFASPARAPARRAERGAMDESDAVATFVGVTGADAPTAQQMLSSCDWNVESAVGLYFASQGGDGGGSGGAAAAAAAQPTGGGMSDADAAAVAAAMGEQDVRAPDAVRRERLYEPAPAQHLVQAGAGVRRQRSGSNNVFDETEEGAAAAGAQHPQGTSEPAPAPPQKGLAGLFAAPTDLDVGGSFEQAKEQALTLGRWMVVNVQKESEFATHQLNRDTWGNDIVKEMLKENFVFFQANMNDEGSDEEATKLVMYYRLQSFPVTLLVDPVTGAKMKRWEGFVQPDQLMEDLMGFMDRSPVAAAAGDPAAPARKVARGGVGPGSVGGQRAAVEAQQQQQQQEQQRQEEQRKLRAEAEAAEAAHVAAAALESARAALPPEPPAGEPSCRIAFRLPDGRRVTRKFPTSATSAALHAFAAVELGSGKPVSLKEGMPGAAPLDPNSTITLAEARLNGVQLLCTLAD